MTGWEIHHMKREWPISKILILGAAALCPVAFGAVLDKFLLQRGVPGGSILFASNVLIGVIAAILILQHDLRETVKHQILKERIETLSEVNQHIRSVLTSVSFYGTQTGSANAEVVSELLRRVEAHLAHLFTQMLFDQSLPQSVLRAARNTVHSINR